MEMRVPRLASAREPCGRPPSAERTEQRDSCAGRARAAPGPARSAPPAAEAPSGERTAGGRRRLARAADTEVPPWAAAAASTVAAEGARSTCGLVSQRGRDDPHSCWFPCLDRACRREEWGGGAEVTPS